MLKKAGIINAPLLECLAELGHRDVCILSDAGFPIPKGVRRLDLALLPGTPGLREVLKAVLAETDVEEAVVSQEITEHNPRMLTDVTALVKNSENIDVKKIPHAEFRKRSEKVKFVLRTGENTPYSNIMLVAGAITNIVTSP